jgi:alpha/beta superfamily hydrolase
VAASRSISVALIVTRPDPLFNGSLDDFRVYERALSKQEFTTLVAVR